MCIFQLCVNYLVHNLSVNSACEAMQAAATYNLEELREDSMIYIEKNTQVSPLNMLNLLTVLKSTVTM